MAETKAKDAGWYWPAVYLLVCHLKRWQNQREKRSAKPKKQGQRTKVLPASRNKRRGWHPLCAGSVRLCYYFGMARPVFLSCRAARWLSALRGHQGYQRAFSLIAALAPSPCRPRNPTGSGAGGPRLRPQADHRHQQPTAENRLQNQRQTTGSPLTNSDAKKAKQKPFLASESPHLREPVEQPAKWDFFP